MPEAQDLNPSTDPPPPHSEMVRTARPIAGPSSRLVIIGWSCWLMGTWWLTIGSGRSHSDIRSMLASSLVGMMLLWPAWRLSQDDPAGEVMPQLSVSPTDVWVEWFSMVLLFQAVLIPLRMTAQWSLSQTVWLDAGMIAWTFLTAGIVAWGCHPGSPVYRTVAMVLCVVLLLGEPAVLALLGLFGTAADWTLGLSPIHIIWRLSVPAVGWVDDPPMLQLAATTATGVAAWIFAQQSHAARISSHVST